MKFYKDPRILILDKLQRFEKFQYAVQDHTYGFVFPYEVSADAVAAARLYTAQELAKRSKFPSMHGNFAEYAACLRSPAEIFGRYGGCSLITNESPDMQNSKPEMHEIYAFLRLKKFMKTLFRDATGVDAKARLLLSCDDIPEITDDHACMILNIVGDGSEYFDGTGNQYHVPLNHIFLSRGLRHEDTAPRAESTDVSARLVLTAKMPQQYIFSSPLRATEKHLAYGTPCPRYPFERATTKKTADQHPRIRGWSTVFSPLLASA